MKNISDLVNKVRDAFGNKEYRHAYIDEFLNISIATQIKVLREQRGWKQEDLAREANMKQPRISVMENVNYSSWSINTLKKLAEAFDLVLHVSFESFGERLKDISQFNRTALEKPSFKDDPVFAEERAVSVAALADVTALEEAKRELACANKTPDVVLGYRQPKPLAARQINPYGSKLHETPFSKASQSNLAH